MMWYDIDEDGNVIKLPYKFAIPRCMSGGGQYLRMVRKTYIPTIFSNNRERAKLSKAHISSVFLATNHDFVSTSKDEEETEEYKPLIFETMIFYSLDSQEYCERYRSMEAMILDHIKLEDGMPKDIKDKMLVLDRDYFIKNKTTKLPNRD